MEVIEERFSAALRASGVDSESELLQRLEPFPAIEAALLDLPEEYREVAVLIDVEELSYEEAALALACPVGTVRSRLHRARKMLFAALRDDARRAGAAKV